MPTHLQTCMLREVHTNLFVLYYTILYYTILYYTILYYSILYYTILYYTILYYTILYYTILYYTILYCSILSYILYMQAHASTRDLLGNPAEPNGRAEARAEDTGVSRCLAVEVKRQTSKAIVVFYVRLYIYIDI